MLYHLQKVRMIEKESSTSAKGHKADGSQMEVNGGEKTAIRDVCYL